MVLVLVATAVMVVAIRWILVSTAAPAEAPMAARIRIRAGTGLGGGVVGGGGNRRRSSCWLLRLCGDGRFQDDFYHQKRLHGRTVATTNGPRRTVAPTERSIGIIFTDSTQIE